MTQAKATAPQKARSAPVASSPESGTTSNASPPPTSTSRLARLARKARAEVARFKPASLRECAICLQRLLQQRAGRLGSHLSPERSRMKPKAAVFRDRLQLAGSGSLRTKRRRKTDETTPCLAGIRGRTDACRRRLPPPPTSPIRSTETSRFNWKSYHDFADTHDLSGQTLSVFGPWLTADKEGFEKVLAYFAGGDRGEDRELRLRLLRAADRHRHPGWQPGQHLHLPAARSCRRRCLEGLSIAARRRHEAVAARQLRRRPVVGRSLHLQGQGRQSAALHLPLEGGPEEPRLVRAGELPGSRLRDSQDDGGSEGADPEDRRRRRHAVVHRPRLRLRRPAGRRPTGSRTSCSASTRRTSTTAGSTTPSSSTTRALIKAIEEFGWFAKNDKFVDGGAAAVAATDFRDSPKGLFASPPKCYMHRQASFIPAFFPEGTELGKDANFFYFPPYASETSASRCLAAARCSRSPRTRRRRAPSSSSWRRRSHLKSPWRGGTSSRRSRGSTRRSTRPTRCAARTRSCSTRRPSASTGRT